MKTLLSTAMAVTPAEHPEQPVACIAPVPPGAHHDLRPRSIAPDRGRIRLQGAKTAAAVIAATGETFARNATRPAR